MRQGSTDLSRTTWHTRASEIIGFAQAPRVGVSWSRPGSCGWRARCASLGSTKNRSSHFPLVNSRGPLNRDYARWLVGSMPEPSRAPTEAGWNGWGDLIWLVIRGMGARKRLTPAEEPTESITISGCAWPRDSCKLRI